MDLVQFDIDLNSNPPVFHPGQKISGKVLIQLIAKKHVEGIVVKIEGRGTVLWKKARKKKYSLRRDRQVAIFHGGETYLSVKQHLTEPGLFEAGYYKFDFQICLPNPLPSTYRTRYAAVEYDAEALLMFNGDNRFCSVPFIVINSLNLNLYPSVNEKVYKSVTSYSNCCYTTGLIELIVSVNNTGFIPGDEIPVYIELQNTSGLFIASVKLILIQKTIMKASFPFEEEKSVVATLASKELSGLRRQPSSFCNANLIVPQVPVPNLKGCAIIEVNYELRVKLVPSAFYSIASVSIPITLGNIPFDSNLVSF